MTQSPDLPHNTCQSSGVDVEHQFGHDDKKVLSRESGYSGFFRITKLVLEHKLFEGGWMQPIHRELFERGNGAAVLLFDPHADTIVLLEQFRVGALDEPSPWVFELVAGIIETGEDPEGVVVREAQEEAGCQLEKVMPICDYLVSPGGTNEKIFLFCAKVDSSKISGLHGLQHEGEDIKVHVVAREQANAMLSKGRINNACSIIALQWLMLNLEHVRKNFTE